MDIFSELSWLGKYLGSRLDLVQAGGGNISVKDGNELYIKSSGCILSEVSDMGMDVLTNHIALLILQDMTLFAFLCASGVSTVTNYLGQKFFVFKKF